LANASTQVPSYKSDGKRGGTVIELRDKQTGAIIGRISAAQLQFLIDHLEEESEEDVDYYINGPTLDLLARKGADENLLGILSKGLGERDEMEIEWSRI
jgi:hypothetical protein